MRVSDRHGRKKVNTISMYILMLCMSTLTCWCKKENMEDTRKSGETSGKRSDSESIIQKQQQQKG